MLNGGLNARSRVDWPSLALSRVRSPMSTAHRAEVLVLGWGSSYGAILAGVRRVRARGKKVARIHLRHLNPLPSNLGDELRRFKKVLVPELNRGQLVRMVRAEYLVEAVGYSKVQGQPFKAAEIEAKILEMMG